MRWQIHTNEPTEPEVLTLELQAALDAFLAKNPIPTPALEQIDAALASSSDQHRPSLELMKKDHLANNPHPDTPRLEAQIQLAIEAAQLIAAATSSPVHASLSGDLETGAVTVSVAAVLPE